MMYQDKFVAVVKVNGKVLREQDDIVQLPFGSEYSILLKNLSTKRAVVKIEIDGREVTGGGLVVNANRDVEIERFIDNDDLNKGYKFKFIQKTKEVQEFRGDKVDDGIIRIEWQYEQEPVFHYVTNTPWHASGGLIGSSYNTRGLTQKFTKGSSDVFCCAASPLMSFGGDVGESLNDNPLKDEGITVEGSDSDQKFRTVTVGTLECEKHVIVLKLLGATKQKEEVKKPVFVKTTIRCKQCGKVHPIEANFCSRCSARLIKDEIFKGPVCNDSTTAY